MRIKLDENLSNTHTEFLRQAGYDTGRVTDEGLSGAEDRFFITLDLDFSDVRQFIPGTHPGILLLRPRNRSSQAILEVLEKILREYSLEIFQGCLVVADEQKTRIRRPL